MTIKIVTAKIIIVISLIELIIMLLISATGINISPNLEALIDVLILSALSTPIIYFWVIKPFIEQRDVAEQKIRHLALHDHLTGLPNRRLLEQNIEQKLAFCSRNSVYGALMFIDLNGFKPINDKYGHESGDDVLKHVANALVNTVRKTDIAARLGGDEFVVLLTNIECDSTKIQESVLLVAEKLLGAISDRIVVKGDCIQVCASIGIRIIEPGDNSKDSVIRDADNAMYKAKQPDGTPIIFSD